MNGLTEAQKTVLQLYRERALECQPPPSLQQVAEYIGCVSTSTADGHVKALLKKGALRGRGHGRKGAIYVPTALEMLQHQWGLMGQGERLEFVQANKKALKEMLAG